MSWQNSKTMQIPEICPKSTKWKNNKWKFQYKNEIYQWRSDISWWTNRQEGHQYDPGKLNERHSPTTLSAYYQHLRGLQTKLTSFNTSTPAFDDTDILIFTETWLHNEVGDAELNLSNYNIYRQDRISNTSQHNRGGGVMVAIRKKYTSNVIESFNYGVEQIFVNVTMNNSHHIICLAYVL